MIECVLPVVGVASFLHSLDLAGIEYSTARQIDWAYMALQTLLFITSTRSRLFNAKLEDRGCSNVVHQSHSGKANVLLSRGQFPQLPSFNIRPHCSSLT